MSDTGKLATLLDDAEVRALLFGLAHVASAAPPAAAGPPRLHAVVLDLAGTTDPEQYGSWLSDDAPNRAMTADQVRASIGDGALDDLARLTGGSRSDVAWQLAAVLPDLVDAVSPGGVVIDADLFSQRIATVAADDYRSAGAFGPRVY